MTVNLELGLVRDRDQRHFEINLRLTGPSGIDHTPKRHSVELRHEELRGLVSDEREGEYARVLSEMLFSVPDIRNHYERAMQIARDDPVHFRLHLGTEPAWVHDLRWESLRAPDGSGPIATKAGVWFSRYLTNEHWLQISSSGGRGNALVVVSSPSDYAGYNLHRVERDEEILRARKALAGYAIDILPRASLDELAERLNENSYEVLYLVAHGRLAGDVPSLAMENAQGHYDGVDARRLAEHIDGLDHKPSWQMPVMAHGRSNLTQVAQYLVVEKGAARRSDHRARDADDHRAGSRCDRRAARRRDHSCRRGCARARGVRRERSSWQSPPGP